MQYDQLIGELYDIANDQRITQEFEEQVRWLNFKVRKNGVKEENESFDLDEESDVRASVDEIISDLNQLADQTTESDIRMHLIGIAEDIAVNRITMDD